MVGMLLGDFCFTVVPCGHLEGFPGHVLICRIYLT